MRHRGETRDTDILEKEGDRARETERAKKRDANVEAEKKGMIHRQRQREQYIH